MMNCRHARLLALALAGAAALAMPLGALPAIGSVTAAPVSPPAPAGGHGEVIAQGAVTFTDGDVHWTVSSEVLRSGSPAVAAAGGDPTFIAVTSGALMVTDAADATDRPLARIGAGEALFAPAAPSANVAAADGLDAQFERIGIAPAGTGASVGDPFAPGASVRDVDLVRDVLAPGESLPVVDSVAGPALVMVTSGAVTVTGAPASPVELAAGPPATLDGPLTIANSGGEPAIVLVAVVGPLVQTSPLPAAEAVAPPPLPTQPAGPTTPTTPPAPTEPDADGDGLSDADEARLGTMPDNPDSDGDDLRDGDEVHLYGTDPLSSRTDFDHLEDGLEIERGTDPLDDDTDDDGCQDSSDDNPLMGDGDCDGDTLSFDQERQLGTDPANPDTDGDGMDDDMDPEPLNADNSGNGGNGGDTGDGESPPPTDAAAPPPDSMP